MTAGGDKVACVRRPAANLHDSLGPSRGVRDSEPVSESSSALQSP